RALGVLGNPHGESAGGIAGRRTGAVEIGAGSGWVAGIGGVGQRTSGTRIRTRVSRRMAGGHGAPATLMCRRVPHIRETARAGKPKAAAPHTRGGRFNNSSETRRYRSAGLLHTAGREAPGADPHALARTVLGDDPRRLEIREPAAAGLVVGVTDVVPGPRPLAANGANCGHINLLVRARSRSSLII